MILPRRSFITGLISLIAAPAIVRAGSLMPVKQMIIEPVELEIYWITFNPGLPSVTWRLINQGSAQCP